MTDVVVVDSSVANMASICAALERRGARAVVSGDPDLIRRAVRVVLPGVGAFGAGMAALRARGLDEAIAEAARAGTPLLAICLGLQLLCEASDESAGVAGLGIVKGSCRRLPDSVRVPHLGWNLVEPDRDCRLIERMDAAFANSYALREAPAGWAAAWTTHGVRFVAGLERDNILACQFHPELSGVAGADLVARWLEGRRTVAVQPERSTARAPGLAVRLVPCLDVRNGRVVKGVQFTDLRDAGDPAERAAAYEAQGADEIVLLDIAASPGGERTRLDTVKRVRAVLGIPLTVGGGVRSVADARRLLAAGADKVAVNSAAVSNSRLIAELAAEFGSQCVVLAIDARRGSAGWEVLTMGGREATGVDVVAWAKEGTALGAGEVLLTSWDRDGTRAGCDLELVRAVSAAVSVPVIASGGIGSRDDVADAIEAGADAVLAASLFHDGDDTVGAIKASLGDRGVRVRQ